ncbi:MAG: BamA/TamA family outer membrane protein [Myxococcota bacterium]
MVALLLLLMSTPETETQAPVVREVVFEGLQGVDQKALVEGLRHRPPHGLFRQRYTLDSLALELDRRRIEAFLQLRGWFDAVVREVTVEELSNGVRLSFVIDQGHPGRLVDLDFVLTSSQTLSDERRRSLVPLELGAPVDYSKYEEGKVRIAQALRAEGYAHARVDGVVEAKQDVPEARVVYTLRPGPLVRFGPTSIVGTSSVPRTAIRNRIAYQEGQIFDPKLVELTEGRLYQLDLIGSVQLDWPPERNPLPMVISVRDGVPRELRLGGGVARDTVNWELRLRGEYTEADFLHPLQTLRLQLRPSLTFQEDLLRLAPNLEARGSISRDDFLLPRLQGTVSVAYQINQLEGIQVQGPRFELGVQRAFFLDRLVARLSLNFDYFFAVGFDDIDESTTATERSDFGISPSLPLLYAEPRLTYDGRDRPNNPRSGFLVQLRFEGGAALNGGGYTTTTPEARGYLSFSPSTVLASRLQLGTTLFGTLPATRRYFSGGAQSHRGFPNRRLAPSIEDDDGDITPLGGEHELELSIELRQDLFQLFGNTLGIVAFVDGADVAQGLRDLEVPNLHWAPGLGLRYETPVGPVRFDIGYRVNRGEDVRPVSGPVDRLAWHLAIGQAF